MFVSGMTEKVNALPWLWYHYLAQTTQEWDNFDNEVYVSKMLTLEEICLGWIMRTYQITHSSIYYSGFIMVIHEILANQAEVRIANT